MQESFLTFHCRIERGKFDSARVCDIESQRQLFVDWG